MPVFLTLSFGASAMGLQKQCDAEFSKMKMKWVFAKEEYALVTSCIHVCKKMSKSMSGDFDPESVCLKKNKFSKMTYLEGNCYSACVCLGDDKAPIKLSNPHIRKSCISGALSGDREATTRVEKSGFKWWNPFTWFSS